MGQRQDEEEEDAETERQAQLPVVEVVDDASNETSCANCDQDDPEDLPKRAGRQRNVVETVCGGPEIEP